MIQDWLKRLRTFWSANRRNQVIVAASCAVVLVLLVSSIALLATRGGASANGIAQATATPLPQTATRLALLPPLAPQARHCPQAPSIDLSSVAHRRPSPQHTANQPAPASTAAITCRRWTTMVVAPSAASPSSWIARRATWLGWSSARHKMRRSTRQTYSQ